MTNAASRSTLRRVTLNELVTLRRPFHGLPLGATGRVIGFYRREAERLAVVSFAGRVEAVPLLLLAVRDAA